MENMRATMKAKDAAEYLGCSYWMLLEMVKRKELPCIEIGNRKLFRKDSLIQWLANKESTSIAYPADDSGKLRKIKG